MKSASTAKEPAHAFTVVAIGASAGGLDAVTQLLQNLAPDTGMAFIYVQHLSPDHKSLLTPILSNLTKMKVQDIDEMEKIKPDNVYVIPFNKEIEVIDGHIQLLPRPKNKSSNLSIDVLFSSLAETHKENVIGIVLSGNASDGTRGLKEIKLAGGITFAQDDSAKFNSMPNSAIAEGVVDFVLSPKEISAEINWMSKHPLVKKRAVKSAPEDEIDDSDPDLKTILQQLYKAKRVDFSHYKMSTIKRRMLRRMLIHKIKDLKQYAELLGQKNNETDLLYQDLLINVSEFFRDKEAFQMLQTKILPPLIKSKAPGETLRIWVAACATGEEVYSIAMSLFELQEINNRFVPFRIIASDISLSAINESRAGEYSAYQLTNVSPQRLQQFFTKSKDKYRISKSIRDVCVFAHHNLLADPAFSRMDFISCRNMLTYLEDSAQRKVIETLHYALNEGGCLMLGKSETIGTSVDLFIPIDKKFNIYARRKNSDTHSITYTNTRVLNKTLPVREDASGTAPKKTSSITNDPLSDAFDAIILAQFVPASVIINYNLDILHFRGSTSAYLQFATGKASSNILKMAHSEITFELQNAIQIAIKTQKRVYKTGVEMNRDVMGEMVSLINLEVMPFKIEGEEPMLMVVFTGQEIEILAQKNQDEKNNSNAKERRIKKLEEELTAVRFEVRSITQNQEVAYEELESANEELQSLNEELETSQEELESTAEELITSNQELRARIEQVEELNHYTETILETIHEPMLILDKNMRIKSANSSFFKTFQVAEADTIGESLFKLSNNQWNIVRLQDLLEDIVFENNRFHNFEIELTFPVIGHKIMLLNAHRIVQHSRNETLIVLTIIDITDARGLALEIASKEKRALEIRLDAETNAMKKIEESNKRYYMMLMNSPFAFSIMKGKNMVIALVNDLMKEFWGKGQEVEGKTLLEVLPEIINQPFPAMMHKVYSTGIPIYANEILARIEHEDKVENLYFNVVYQPHFEVDETISGVITIAYDVTELVLARKKAEESEHRYRMLIEEASVATALFLGPEICVQYANDIMLGYWGKGKAPLGKPLIESMPEIIGQPFPAYLESVYTSGIAYTGVEEKVDIMINGKLESFYFNFTYKALRDIEKNIYGIHMMAMDVTGEVLAKKALEASEKKFRQLVDSMPHKISTADHAGNVTFLNQQWLEDTGYSFEELKKWGWDKLIHPEDLENSLENWRHSIESGDIFDVECRIINREGEYKWHLSRALALKDESGAIKMWVGSNTDIHEQKEAKHKAEAAAQLAEETVKAKQQFLSNMSHEIRTPMNAIIGFTNVILKTKLEDKQKEYILAIKESGDALLVLINDILDLAKVDAGKMTFEQTSFNISASVATMLHLFEAKIQEQNLTLIEEYDADIPPLLVGDPIRLRQIILNLVSNAVKFTRKGNITMHVRLLSQDTEKASIEFMLTDTGIGIAKNKLEQVFNNFEQTHEEGRGTFGGTGLGLAIVKQLVERQGGAITVTSELGKGSAFSFVLNFKKPENATESDTNSISETKTAIENVRVLVVEDMTLNQLLIKIIVEEFGFEIDVAGNGKIAIEMLQKNKYDIILMDLQMPEMNGFEATAYIRQQMKDQIPIIALTADVTTMDLEKCLEIGMNDYISKPIDEKVLYNKMISCLT